MTYFNIDLFDPPEEKHGSEVLRIFFVDADDAFAGMHGKRNLKEYVKALVYRTDISRRQVSVFDDVRKTPASISLNLPHKTR